MKLLSAIKYLLVFFLFAGMGCEDAIQDQTYTIHINQLYTSSDGQYSFQINEIIDSRCPEGVQCVWQGEVVLKGDWTFNKNKTAIELHSVSKNQEKQPDGFTIQIMDALPYPKYGTESKPENLVVTLLIQKKSTNR
jgi:hypothetical protein